MFLDLSENVLVISTPLHQTWQYTMDLHKTSPLILIFFFFSYDIYLFYFTFTLNFIIKKKLFWSTLYILELKNLHIYILIMLLGT